MLLIGRVLSGLYVDYQWFAAMRAASVWRVHLVNRVLLSGCTILATTLFAFANLYAVRRSIVSIVLPRRMGNLEIGEEVPGRYLTGLTVAASIVLGILLALPPEPWTLLAGARYGLPFGDTDPYFQSDLGFYVYWLPLENALYVRALLVLFGTAIAVIVLYVAVTPSLRWDRTRFRITAHVRRHVAALTPCFFALVAWNYRLNAYAVLAHGGGPSGLFTATDQHVVIPADRALALLLLAAGIVAGVALWRGQIRTTLAVLTVSLVVLAAYHISLPLVEHAAPGIVEDHRDPYAVLRGQATREAYGVRRMATAGGARAPAHYSSLAAAAAEISIWDPGALTQALERSRGRGRIADAVAWRTSPAGLLAVAVEIGSAAGAGESPGLALPMGALIPVRATTADDRGAPERTDLVGRPSADDVLIPPVLVHTAASGPVIVADSLGRIAAPEIDGFVARLANAWSEQRLGLIAADLPGPHPKLVAHRDVLDRVRRVAPFFVTGGVVWPVVDADSVYWVMDLYSSAELYPLSQHFYLVGEERSYFQHAATAFVQAHTGRVTLVADSARDPIAETWVRRFPELFVPWSALPPALAAGAPPPTDAALAMAAAFGAAGVRTPAGADGSRGPAHVPSENVDSLLTGGEPPCLAGVGAGGARGAGGAGGSCSWPVPLTDASGRVTGLVAAVGGPERGVVWIPLDTSVVRWAGSMDHLRSAIDSALGSRREPALARGRVRPFVVGAALALAQPVYAWRADGPPALLDVAALAGDSTLAVRSLVEATSAEPAVAPGAADGPATTGAAFRVRVAALYDSMQAALRRGDLTAFGAAYGELGRLLGRPPEPRAAAPPGR